MTDNIWINAGLIFILRVINMALDTLRLRMVSAWQEGLGMGLRCGRDADLCLYSLKCVQRPGQWLDMAAYAIGFATGNVVGMWLEDRMAVGFIHLRVVSPNRGAMIAERLREGGFAVTEISGRGRDGMVALLDLSVKRKNFKKVRMLIEELDANAFITSEDLQPVRARVLGDRVIENHHS